MPVASGGSATTFYDKICTPNVAGGTPGHPDRTAADTECIPGSVRRTSSHAGCTLGITGGASDNDRSAPDEKRCTPDIVRDTPDGKRCAPDDARDASGDAGDVSGDDRCMEIKELRQNCKNHRFDGTDGVGNSCSCISCGLR